MTAIRFQRRPEVLKQTGLSNSTLHKRINQGLFMPPISLGLRAVAWPEHEVSQLLAAITAGMPEWELRKLVKELVEARKGIALAGGMRNVS